MYNRLLSYTDTCSRHALALHCRKNNMQEEEPANLPEPWDVNLSFFLGPAEEVDFPFFIGPGEKTRYLWPGVDEGDRAFFLMDSFEFPLANREQVGETIAALFCLGLHFKSASAACSLSCCQTMQGCQAKSVLHQQLLCLR